MMLYSDGIEKRFRETLDRAMAMREPLDTGSYLLAELSGRTSFWANLLASILNRAVEFREIRQALDVVASRLPYAQLTCQELYGVRVTHEFRRAWECFESLKVTTEEMSYVSDQALWDFCLVEVEPTVAGDAICEVCKSAREDVVERVGDCTYFR